MHFSDTQFTTEKMLSNQEFKRYQLFHLDIHSQDPSAHHVERCTCDKWKGSKFVIFHVKKVPMMHVSDTFYARKLQAVNRNLLNLFFDHQTF